MNTVFLTESLNIVVVILPYFFDNGRQGVGGWKGWRAGSVNENAHQEPTSPPPYTGENIDETLS
jgi:hypothetical protein